MPWNVPVTWVLCDALNFEMRSLSRSPRTPLWPCQKLIMTAGSGAAVPCAGCGACVDGPAPPAHALATSATAIKAVRKNIMALASRATIVPAGDSRPHAGWLARSPRLPGDEPALELVQEQERDVADERDDEQPRVHLLHLERLVRVLDQVADPRTRGEDLGDDDEDKRVPPRETDPREDERQRAGKRERAEDLEPSRAEAAPHVEVHRLDAEHAGHGVQQHEEEDADRHDRVLRGLADAEDEEQEREDRRLRHRVERTDDGLERRADEPRQPHRDADDEAGDGAEGEADEDAAEATTGMVDELAGAHEVDERPGDRARRGEEARVEHAGAPGALPYREQQDRRRDADEPLRGHAFEEPAAQAPARARGADLDRHDARAIALKLPRTS